MFGSFRGKVLRCGSKSMTSVTPHEAFYVAAALFQGIPLMTADGRLSRTLDLRVVIQHGHMGSSENCTWTNIISLPRKIGIRHMDDHKAVAVDEEYFYNRSCISRSGRATGNFFNSGTALFLTYGRRRCFSLSLECQRVGTAGDN